MKTKNISLALFFVLIAIFFAPLQMSWSADDNSDENMDLLMMDISSSDNQDDLNLLESIVLIMEARNEKLFASGLYGEEIRRISKIDTTSEINSLTENIDYIKNFDTNGSNSDQLGALTEIYSFLSSNDAKFGSNIYIITNGRILGESESTPQRFLDLSELFLKEGWKINILMLPSSEIGVRDLFKKVSDTTNGHFYDLGDFVGLNTLLSDISGNQFEEIQNINLMQGIPSIKSIDIPPSTSEINLLFLKKSHITPELYDPSGNLITELYDESNVTRTKNIDFITIRNPIVGKWLIRADGENSYFTILKNFSTNIEMSLMGDKIYPVNTEILFEIKIKNPTSEILQIDGTVDALIRDPSGKVAMYELFDSGFYGDRFESDGIYSTKFFSDKKQGISDVEVRINWKSSSSPVSQNFTFRTEYFPDLDLEIENSFEFQKDQIIDKQYLGKIISNKANYPFFIDEEDLNISVKNKSTNEIIEIQLIPVDIVDNNKYWKFDIYSKFDQSGTYEIDAFLSGTYLGSNYKTPTLNEKINVDIIIPTNEVMGTYILRSVLIVLVIIGIITLSYLYFSRFSPYGMLVDDKDNIIVDFKKFSRPLEKLVFRRNRIYADEINNIPFSGGSFVFRKNHVMLEKNPKINDPSIRVNGLPSSDVIDLNEDVILGVAGRLIRYKKS